MAYTSALEVALEMLESVGAQSSNAGATIPLRSYMQFNAGDFDGNALFYFEIFCDNADSSSKDVKLRDTTNAADKATITVTNGAAKSRFRSAAFTPAAGEVVYALSMPQTTSVGNMKCYAARVVVVQDATATKTVIDIPMITNTYAASSNDVTLDTDNTGSTSTYTQGSGKEHHFYRFHKTASNWATVKATTGCALDLNMVPWTSGKVCRCGLLDITNSNAEIAYVEATAPDGNGTLQHKYVEFDWASMPDGHDFEVMFKANSDDLRYSRCSLRIKLTDLQKGEIHRLISMDTSASTTARHNDFSRQLYTAANVTTPTVYIEAVGLCADNANVVHLYQDNSDSELDGGSLVTGANINFNSATKAVQRSAAVTPTTGYRVYAHHAATTGALTYQAHMIVAFAGSQPAAPTVTNVNPNSGSVLGGTPVTITGTGFTGATSVHFGAADAPGFTVVSDTSITVNSPPGIG